MKKLILGCAATGAKYTPKNHVPSGNVVADSIWRGDYIPVSVEEITADAVASYQEGCRYFHIHARNPITREQTTDLDWYRQCALAIRKACPDMLLSFGGSRNGKEVIESIAKFGEWARLAQCSVPLTQGGGALHDNACCH